MASDLFKELTSRLSLEGVDIDNWTFKFYSRASVGIFLVAATISIASAYTGSPIQCKGDVTDYDTTYCWLHGTKHLPHGQISDVINNGDTCFTYDADENGKATTYYIWVSLVLFLSALLFVIPNELWKHFEGGMMEQFGSNRKEFLKDTEKCALKFKELSKNQTKRYFYTFVFFEVLNYVIGLTIFILTDTFLSGKFFSYGFKTLAYFQDKLECTEINMDGNGETCQVINPMCSVFPTTVNCQFFFFGVNAQQDKRSNICIMGQNLMNQKIYLVLWVWFLVLFTVSGCMLLYRLLTLSLPELQRTELRQCIKSEDVGAVQALILDLDHIGNWYLLTQIGRNATPYAFREFLNEVVGRTKRINAEREKHKRQKAIKDNGSNNELSSHPSFGKLKENDLEMGYMGVN